MRLASLSTIALSVPLARPPRGRSHPLGAPFVTYCLVRAESDDGQVGWGEISDGWGCEYPQVADSLVREALSRFVVGEDPRDVGAHVSRMWAWLQRRQGTQWLVAQAVSGVEIALWDLVARAEGKPVGELVGPVIRRSIPIYATGLALSQGDAEVHRRFFQPLLDRGLRAVKVRLGPDWQEELGTLHELRALLGRDVTIGVDGNETFSAMTASHITETLADLDIAFFEEPIPRTDASGLAWLNERSRVPIAYGEHVHTAAGFRELSDGKLASIWQPDVTACGGFLEVKEIARLAAELHVTISPHSATTPLGMAANLHAASLAPTLSRMECSATGLDELASCFEGSERFADAIAEGELFVPTGPGLGVSPKIDEIQARFPYRPPWPIRDLPALYRGAV